METIKLAFFWLVPICTIMLVAYVGWYSGAGLVEVAVVTVILTHTTSHLALNVMYPDVSGEL